MELKNFKTQKQLLKSVRDYRTRFTESTVFAISERVINKNGKRQTT